MFPSSSPCPTAALHCTVVCKRLRTRGACVARRSLCRSPFNGQPSTVGESVRVAACGRPSAKHIIPFPEGRAVRTDHCSAAVPCLLPDLLLVQGHSCRDPVPWGRGSMRHLTRPLCGQRVGAGTGAGAGAGLLSRGRAAGTGGTARAGACAEAPTGTRARRRGPNGTAPGPSRGRGARWGTRPVCAPSPRS